MIDLRTIDEMTRKLADSLPPGLSQKKAELEAQFRTVLTGAFERIMPLDILATHDRPFLMVVEEEGSDNFANDNNAAGALEALRRADEAIGVVLEHIEDNPQTLLVTAADSDAGGLEVMAVRDREAFGLPLPAVTGNGSPIDGRGGTGQNPADFKQVPFLRVGAGGLAI